MTPPHTHTPSVGAQVPGTREQGEGEDWGCLFQQHLGVRPQQALTLLVSKGTFVLTLARCLSECNQSLSLLKTAGA